MLEALGNHMLWRVGGQSYENSGTCDSSFFCSHPVVKDMPARSLRSRRQIPACFIPCHRERSPATPSSPWVTLRNDESDWYTGWLGEVCQHYLGFLRQVPLSVRASPPPGPHHLPGSVTLEKQKNSPVGESHTDSGCPH